jgi:membrane-bound lytic murein transglycosylase B
MKLTRLAMPLIAAALMTSPVITLAQNSQNATPAAQDWNTPPAGTEQSQQAFRDGIEAAKLDKAAKRTIDAKTSHLYKKPPVKKNQQDAYRSDFEKGYQAQVSHDSTL